MTDPHGMQRGTRPRRHRRVTGALMAGLLATVTLWVAAVPAARAELGDQGQVTVDKRANGQSELAGVAPGDTIAYTLVVGCDDNPCIDAAVTDPLPAAFADFTLVSATSNPSATSTVTLTGCSAGGAVGGSCVVDVSFDESLGDIDGTPQTGIPAGVTYTVTVQLLVPLDLDPSWASNGIAVPNTATATATNSTTRTSTASATVDVPYVVDVATTKQWSAESVQYQPGAPLSFTVTGANASNTRADSLVIEDPIGAVDGAATLAADNPFTFMDYTGLCAPSSLPEGADAVQVDLYTFDGSAWSWQLGTPAATPTPPEVGTNPVGGIRFTYTSSTGTTIVAGGAAGQQCVSSAQRATNRTTGASLVAGVTVPNTAQATVTVPDHEPATRTVTDTLVIGALTIDVTPGKTITPEQVPASGTFNVALTGRNDSNGPLTSMTITEPDDPTNDPFLSDDLQFDGFTSWVWPAGATAGTITWFRDGAPPITDATLTADSGPPTPPAQPPTITGFSITYTGAIAAGTTAGVGFDVKTAADTVPPGTVSTTFTNTMGLSGTNAAGTDADTATDDVAVYFPTIDLSLAKTISPSLVTPGGTVLVELPAQTATNVPTVDPTQIVIEDVWNGSADTFWDAFRVRSVTFTDVPAGSTMKVEYATGTPPSVTWTTLDDGVTTSPYSATFPSSDDIVGVRFTFSDADGFPQGAIVQPNLVFEASDTLRTGGSTAQPDAVPVPYQNTATANASGDADGVPVVAPEQNADATTSIVDYGGGGPGTILSAKRWVRSDWSTDLAVVNSQSGTGAFTRHSWGVTVPGYTSVVLSDSLPGDETNPADTTFQAFDLRALRPVSFAEDPLLQWDQVQSIELFESGSWTTVAPPGGSWMNSTGFRGYTLSDAEAAATTGVRVTYVANDPARAASTTPGRPDPGTGVAWGATGRWFGLQWKLRNTLRVPGATPWATEDVTYNASDRGVVRNDFRVAGTTSTDTFTHDSSDTIQLIDTPPGVETAKAVDPTSVVVPFPGDVPLDGYPTVDVNIGAWNTASARASYVRVADSCPTASECLTAANDHSPDVFTGRTYSPGNNPFERFTLTGVDFVVPTSVPVDPSASQVALWRYDQGTGTTSVSTTTMAALDALGPADLADVVGIGVTYQSSDPGTTGGLIPTGSSSTNVIGMVLHTQLRAELRSQPGTDVGGGVSVDDVAVAQSFDPVLSPNATPNASDRATVELEVAGLEVTASKAISPGTILETDPDVPVTVRLRATDGASTLAAETATISDTDSDFWDTFRLTGLGAVTRPVGADLVRVDLQVNDDPTWIQGVAAPVAALPASVTDLATVTGIRFVFLNDPIRPFSATSPSAHWSAQALLQVVLRDGTAFPGSVENTVDTRSTHRGYPDATDVATATVVLSTGTPALDVEKEPVTGTGQKIVEPGVSVPWTLRFTNTGTSFLDVTKVTDALGPSLRWDGQPPGYASTGSLPTVGIDVTQPSIDALEFTFPDGSRMAPGDSFTITVGLILQPGLTASQRATNRFTVHTTQSFASGACTNTSGNGQGVLPGLGVNECGTSNFVQPQSGPLLFTDKSVKGEVNGDLVDGAGNVSNPLLPCTPDSAGYFRGACAAYTVIGATDQWQLRAVNTGTTPYTKLTLVDPLPTLGDRLLATGSSRGSQWRPVFDLASGVTSTVALPPGTSTTVEVTTDAAPCVGTGPSSAWPADPTCSSDTWAALASYGGDPASITGLRVTLDFTQSTTGNLPAGGAVGFTYQTIDVPQQGGLPTADAVVPDLGTDARQAWNQTGVTAQLVGGQTLSRAPARTGVQLVVGALGVEKTISGGAADHAPTSFPFDLTCTVPDAAGGTAPVDLGTDAELDVPTNGSARVDGIPLGATCTVSESGAVGDHGETGRDPATPQSVDVDTRTGPDDPLPAADMVSFDNTYEYATLTVQKEVDERTNPEVDFGPWHFHIVCTTPFPTPTTVLDTTFSLDLPPDSYAIPADTVPVNATCTLTETDPGDATTITGDGVTDNGDGSATITVGADAQVVVTNAYSVGTLEVSKQRTGDGVDRYGAGPFVVDATCTYDLAVVYTGSVTLDDANGYGARFQEDGTDAVMRAGTECLLHESKTAGATGSPTFDPSPLVTIVGGEPGGPPPVTSTSVTVTNPFDTGAIAVQKEVTGSGAELYGHGPFVVRVQCTYDRDGEETVVDWNDVAYLDLELNDANGFRQTVDDLPVGAQCAVIQETTTGGATDVVISDPVIVPAEGEPAVTIEVTNTFDAGSLDIIKERTGAGADALGAGPFTVSIACAAQVDGDTVELVIPGGSTRDLDQANGYRTEVGLLPVGAHCTVVETGAGGATSTTYEPSDGQVTITAAPDTATVRIVNSFDPPAGAGAGRLAFTGSSRGRLVGLTVLGFVFVAVGVVLVRRRTRAGR